MFCGPIVSKRCLGYYKIKSCMCKIPLTHIKDDFVTSIGYPSGSTKTILLTASLKQDLIMRIQQPS